jgi:hypothetical protein
MPCTVMSRLPVSTGACSLGDPHLQLHREAQRSTSVVVARVVVVRHKSDTVSWNLSSVLATATMAAGGTSYQVLPPG